MLSSVLVRFSASELPYAYATYVARGYSIMYLNKRSILSLSL